MPSHRWIIPLAVSVLSAAACAQDPIESASDRPFAAWLEGESEPAVLPQGTELRARLVNPLNTTSSYPGEPVLATLTRDVRIEGDVAVPEGATIHGLVRESLPAVMGGGDALLAVEFTQIELPDGSRAQIKASLRRASEKRKDRTTDLIAGSTSRSRLGGPGAGRDSGDNALVGSVVGAAMGTGIVMSRNGMQVNLPEGTRLRIRLDGPARIPSIS